MDQDQNEPAARAGTSHDMDSVDAVDSGDGGNPVAQLQSQIFELGQKHDQVMSALSNLSNVSTRSYVYIPRERQIVPFSGDLAKDGQTVDEFIDEVERVIRVRGLNPDDQVDFILSHLRGSALDEVKLCMGGGAKPPQDLFSYLRGAFREKRTTPQLLHAFYARKQLEGEDFRDYSHALSQLLNSALQQSANGVADPQLNLRDQFIEGVRDGALRRELRKMVREKPQSTLFGVREEAMLWVAEDQPRASNVARNRGIVSSGSEMSEQSNPANAEQSDVAVTLQEVVQMIAQQGKAIGELTNAVRELAVQKSSSNNQGGKPKFKPKYTDDGQPICLKCEGVGHIARQCNITHNSRGQSTTATGPAVQGNGVPPLR
ncbi:rap guanine nucleotide exchange factor 6-like [Triplophysa rosa]|uniref:Rap guanine nucleotide exchange factor 6-like n=1 Tax=Triplophysa rosa TaxID=992332 RepID=A0A9W8C5G3_TRIRA|nr:rap guanine nucleotide exchange factor 6-like [Triplophysa rosa]